MGNYTYGEFQSSLTLELWNRDDVSTRVGGWVNAAYMDLCTRNRFWELKMPTNFEFHEMNTSETRTTMDGVAFIATPSTALIINSVFDNTNLRKLYHMSPREYFSKTDRTTAASEGQPTHWVRYGTSIYLWPTPASSYSMSVYFRRRPAVLTASTDKTAIGAEWDEPILKLAVIQSMMRLKQYESAAVERQEWVSRVQDIIGIYAKEALDDKKVAGIDQTYHQWDYGSGGAK